jgi:hypothetical protein
MPDQSDRITDADCARNAAEQHAYVDGIPVPDGDGPVLRNGDTLHYRVTYSDAELTGGDYTVTDRDGAVLGWGELEHDADGYFDFRFYKRGQPPEQRPDPGDDLRLAAGRDAGADGGAGRAAEPPGGGGEPRRPGAADRGAVPDSHAVAYTLPGGHRHAVTDRPGKFHDHYHLDGYSDHGRAGPGHTHGRGLFGPADYGA